jgi:adenosylcobinamide-phosphate synthase
MAAWQMALAIGIALGVDRVFGEPPARWHPVVGMGRYLGATGRRIAPTASAASMAAPARWRPFMLGAAAWCVGAAGVGAIALGLQWAVGQGPGWLAAMLLGLLLKPLLAWRMLRDEVLAVEAALDESLDAGRAQLARLVSRDVAALDAAGVRESAIESLAENLNDSVVAPLFWFVVGGLPGAAVYRFANTADAMWGYLGERNGRDWTWAGKWAARADDVLSWLPARLTAWLLHGQSAGGRRRAAGPAASPAAGAGPRAGLAVLRREAARTPSPNSGWPMAAMALGLGVRLGKPGVYTLNASAATPGAGDVARAARAGGRAVRMLVVGVALAAGVLTFAVRSA